MRLERNPTPGPDPALVVFSTPWTAHQGRSVPFLISLSFHLLVVTAVLVENYLRPPLELQITPPEQLLADDRYKLTWYISRDDLPSIEPLEKPKPVAKKSSGDGSRPRFRLPQRVVADDPGAASRRQVIWDQAPAVELTQDVRSPNFVQWSAPKLQAPRFEAATVQLLSPGRRALSPENAPRIETTAQPRLADSLAKSPQLRYWTPEQQQPAPANRALAAEKAPRVVSSPATPRNLAQLESSPTLRYWTPETEAASPQRRALAPETAPVVSATPGPGLDIGQTQNLSRLRYWMPQEGTEAPGRRALAADGQVPQIQAAPGQSPQLDEFQRLSRLRYQQAEESLGASPARRALTADESTPLFGPASAAALGIPGGGADQVQTQILASIGPIARPAGAEASTGAAEVASASRAAEIESANQGRAVVGVDPDPNASASLPRGRRTGSFTAGPDGGAHAPDNGAGQAGEGETGALASVRIPHLSVSPASSGNGTPGGVSDRASGRQPTNPDREAVLRQFRDANFSPVPAIGVAAPDRTPDPDLPFPGRAVYTLAVNMPNISSYTGSWIIEFAEAKGNDAAPGEIAPPSPRLKVDPVYSRSAADERVEGDVVLHAIIRSDGLVDHIKILKKLDDRLDESARAALSKWRFNPATKRGAPIDIETIVRIPFRLAHPKNERR